MLQYLLEIPKWKSRCEDIQIPDTIQQLEDAISQHQTLIDSIMQAYTDVSWVYLSTSIKPMLCSRSHGSPDFLTTYVGVYLNPQKFPAQCWLSCPIW